MVKSLVAAASPHQGSVAVADMPGAAAALAGLPQVPGVYIFMGEGSLPLYIGKSVNLRSRVQAHFRTASEWRWLSHTRRIDFIATAGEVGALLLEAQLIKTRQPLMNKRLRRNRQLCALRLLGGRPELVYANELDFARAEGLFGPFANARATSVFLQRLADEHRLCLGALGLETLNRSRPCFRAALGKCAGVCRGGESLDAHEARLRGALSDWQLRCWPYPDSVAIVEQRPGMTDYLVVKNWCFLGRAPSLKAARALRAQAAGFDADGYQILCAPMFKDDARVISLEP